MALTTVKAALTQQDFPFNANNFVDCVLRDVGWEQERQVQGFNNQPQAYFMQNVLPQSRGFSSVHFSKVVTDSTYPVYMDKVIQLRDDSGGVALLSPAGGYNFIYTVDLAAWVSFPFASTTFTGKVTSAYLKGVTYVCYEGVGLYVYDFNTNTYTLQSLTSAPAFANVRGVSAAGNYLVLYTDSYFAYSSPSSPLDFTPALGAGGQSQILSNRGKIVTVRPISGGLIVYTTNNAISAQLTANVNFPFKFDAIPDSAGIASYDCVSSETNSEYQFAWTLSGLMAVSPGKAELVFPELSDAFANGLYSIGAGKYPEVVSKDSVRVMISTVGSRYICFSCKDGNSGVVEYPIAYVFDLGLKRWGRIDIPHIGIFEYAAAEFRKAMTYADATKTYDQYDITYENAVTKSASSESRFGSTLGVVRKLGSTYVALTADYANIDLLETTGVGETPLLVLGKYKLVRKQSVLMQWASASNMQDAEMYAIPHDIAGAPLKEVQMIKSSRENSHRCRIQGAAVSLALYGRFSLTSLQFSLEATGARLAPVLVPPVVVGNNNFVLFNGIAVANDGVEVVA